MTDKNLPPLPEPDTHCFDEETSKDVWSHSGAQLTSYALAALAGSDQPGDGFVTIGIDEYDHLGCCRRLLEIIAVGDSSDPVKDAEDELVAHGFWAPQAAPSPSEAPTRPELKQAYTKGYTDATVQFGPVEPAAEPGFRIGGKYNWKNQPERLVYLGHNWSGIGYWHQFAKVDAPDVIWCEVLDFDLASFEVTANPPAQPEAAHARWKDQCGDFAKLEAEVAAEPPATQHCNLCNATGGHREGCPSPIDNSEQPATGALIDEWQVRSWLDTVDTAIEALVDGGMADKATALRKVRAALARQAGTPEFTAAYMKACEGHAPDHNEIGLHYFRAAWQAGTGGEA